jgi:hypothetical protein
LPTDQCRLGVGDQRMRGRIGTQVGEDVGEDGALAPALRNMSRPIGRSSRDAYIPDAIQPWQCWPRG